MAELCQKLEPLFKLRPYQQNAIDEVNGTRESLLIHGPTGSGKSLIMTALVHQYSLQGKRVLIIIRGIDLIRQFSDHLSRNGIRNSIIQADNPLYDANSYVQVASIDTLCRRNLHDVDIILVDEAHFACSRIFKRVLRFYREKDVRVISFTATPYKSEGLKHLADRIHRTITYPELQEQKYLVPLSYFVPTKVNLNKVKKINGEYNNRQLHEVMDDATIYGDIVKNYKKYLKDKPALLYAVNIEHSRQVSRYLNENGIPAAHADESTSQKERVSLTKKLETGEILVLCNVFIFGTGVDIPCLRAVMLCRPTTSYILYLQMVGRVSRPYPGKDRGIVLDMSNNVKKHYFAEDAPEGWLEPRTKSDEFSREKPSGPDPVECQECSCIFLPNRPVKCPECGWKKVTEATEITETNADLIEITDRKKFTEERDREIQMVREIATACYYKNYQPGAVFYKVAEKIGIAAAKRHIPYYRKNNVYDLYADI